MSQFKPNTITLGALREQQAIEDAFALIDEWAKAPHEEGAVFNFEIHDGELVLMP